MLHSLVGTIGLAGLWNAAEVMAELLDHLFTMHRAPYQEIARNSFRGRDSLPWLVHIGLRNRPLLGNGANKLGILIATSNWASKLPNAHVNHCSGLVTKEKAMLISQHGLLFNAGNDLRSHTLSRAVPSALRGLTSVFGMGTGGSPAVRSPTNLRRFRGV